MKLPAAVLAVFLALVGVANAKAFKFIYVEAGEGNSSGGHAAVEFGQEVFHYQYAGGFLRLFKLKGANFRRHYQLLQNRNLHLAHIDVSEKTYDRLLRHFKERFQEQQQKLKYLKALEQNQALLQALLELKGEHALDYSNPLPLSLRLAGAGLFYEDEHSEKRDKEESECHTASSSARVLSTVRHQVDERFGTSFLPGHISAIKNRLAELLPLEDESQAFNDYPFSEHYTDLLSELLALQVLQNATPLRDNACFEASPPQMRLTEQSVQTARSYLNNLVSSALSLLASKRPDKGYALFITLARLIALEHSIQSRHWLFIDDTAETAATITQDQIALYAEQMRQERLDDLKNFQEAVADLSQFSDAYGQNYVAAEIAANRVHQWQLSGGNKPLRYHAEQALPNKSASLKPFLMPNAPIEQLKKALIAQKEISQRLTTEDNDRNTYHLLANNCVSALFALINEAVPGQSAQLLGGYIDPKFNFIPFQAFDSVQSAYNVVKTEKLASYREQKLAEMYDKEESAWVYLRESNIFSSQLYRYNSDDAWFVFFTDDAVFLRPLYGAVNTLTAASQSLVGLVSMPFDEGRQLKTGARGIVASLPELAFFNIRKGSYPYPLTH